MVATTHYEVQRSVWDTLGKKFLAGSLFFRIGDLSPAWIAGIEEEEH